MHRVAKSLKSKLDVILATMTNIPAGRLNDHRWLVQNMWQLEAAHPDLAKAYFYANALMVYAVRNKKGAPA